MKNKDRELTKREKYRKEYYQKNKADAIAKAAAWKKKNPEKVAKGAKVYRDATKEQMKILQKAWHENNPEKRRAISKRHYDKYAEEKRQKSRAYYAANPEKVKEQIAAYRSKPEYRAINANNMLTRRTRISSGKLSSGITEKLLNLQRGKCACCSKALGDDYHLDHIMPLALGGVNVDSNMQLLRKECNLQKHAKHPIDFMQSRGFLC